MILPIRDFLRDPSGRRRGNPLSARPASDYAQRCAANVAKKYGDYQPCNRQMALDDSGAMHCPYHGEMK